MDDRDAWVGARDHCCRSVDRSAHRSVCLFDWDACSCQLPDVAVFGLAPAAANGLVTLVADACRGGTAIPLGPELVGLLDNELRCVFAPIDPGRAAAHFATAVSWFRDEPLDMVQLLYPDRNGFLPYEAGFEQRLRLAQRFSAALRTSRSSVGDELAPFCVDAAATVCH